jgi:hypothetical protein
MDKMSRTWFLVLSIVVIALAFGVGWLVVRQSQPQSAGNLPLGSGFNPVYFDWASKKLIVESGGELEVQTGGVVDMQTGSVTTFAGTQTFDELSMSGTATMNAASVTTSVTAADVTATDDLIVAADALANTVAATTTVSGADFSASGDLVVGDDATVAADLLANTGTFTVSVSAVDFTATDEVRAAGLHATGNITGDNLAITATIAGADVTASDDGQFEDDVRIGGDLVAQTGVFTDTLSAAGITGPITATQIILGGTFTGLRYGMAATVTDAMTITHGLGAAPLFVMLEPYGDGITVPVNVAISDTTSFTVNVPDGVTVANVIWLAGK